MGGVDEAADGYVGASYSCALLLQYYDTTIQLLLLPLLTPTGAHPQMAMSVSRTALHCYYNATTPLLHCYYSSTARLYLAKPRPSSNTCLAGGGKARCVYTGAENRAAASAESREASMTTALLCSCSTTLLNRCATTTLLHYLAKPFPSSTRAAQPAAAAARAECSEADASPKRRGDT